MSVHVSARVWDECRQKGEGLLVMLALADHSNDEGLCWPSLDRIADMSRVERRSVIRIIQRLEEAGEVDVDRGGGRGHSNRYRLAKYARVTGNSDRESLIVPAKGDRESLIEAPNGAEMSPLHYPKTVTPVQERVTLDAETVTPRSPEPLVTVEEPSEERKETDAATAAEVEPYTRWHPFYVLASDHWGEPPYALTGNVRAHYGRMAQMCGRYGGDDVETACILFRSWLKDAESRFAQQPTLAPPKLAAWLDANARTVLSIEAAVQR